MWRHVISAKPFASRYANEDETRSTGKWFVPFPLNDPEDLWDKLVTAACESRITATKVSSNRLEGILGHRLACVYCDSSDKDTVSRTLSVLRELGVQGELRYKTDKATAEGREEFLWTSEDIDASPYSLIPQLTPDSP